MSPYDLALVEPKVSNPMHVLCATGVLMKGG